MLLKNIHIASRFLLKHRQYTAINIAGITLSLVCVLFIGLYIYDELSFDRFHSKSDRIYRVIENTADANGAATSVASVAYRISTLDEQLPAIERTTTLATFGRVNVWTDENENKIYEPFTIADQGFMDIFDFEILHGAAENSLSASHAVVITASTAVRLFGTTDAVGKLIRSESDAEAFRVTAVLKDFPANSHINVNILYAMESFAREDWYREELPGDWSSQEFDTYLLLKPDADRASVAEAISAIVQNNREKKDPRASFALQPLGDVHFHSANITGGMAENPGEIYYLYIFGAVGIFILLIACINYINLSTSLSITRGKEVGVKKVAGAGRMNLMGQFIAESSLVSFTALLLALFLVNMLMPQFNTFVGKDLSMSTLWRPPVLALLGGVGLAIGLLSGSYPAFYLSRFKPALAIKGFLRPGKQSGAVRQGLVVFQFALSIMLIIATLIAFQQLSFIRTKNLGFQKEQLVVLDINSGEVRRGAETIKQEIARIPVVKSVAVSSRVPGEWKSLPRVGVKAEENPELQKLFFIGADDAFLQTYGIDLAAGRNFSVDNIGDSSSFLLNETAARLLGFTEPLQQDLSVETVNYSVEDRPLKAPFKGKVIGIVKDFHFQSLHQAIAPLVIAYRNNPIHSIDYFSVRLMPGDWQAALKDMEKALQAIDENHLIEYNFLDERLADFYKQDIKRGQLFGMAAAVSIGLACLGLFSLASFMTEQRTKEIGIRKALGANAGQIVVMLSGKYLKLVILGFIAATPLAIWLLNQWLQSFAYRIHIGWLSILGACALSMLVAVFTVGFKSLHAAKANPVDSLRSE